MKISDIVKLKIDSSLAYSSNVSEMNNTGAILFIHKLTGDEVGTTNTDSNWLTTTGLGSGYFGKIEMDRAISSYLTNGGIALVAKRIYFDALATDGEMIDEIEKAVYGGSGITETVHIGLPTDVKNIQLVWETQPSFGLGGLASAFIKTSAPETSKLLFVTSTSAPTGLSLTPNVFYHYIDGAQINYFESIAAMAYLSKINYETDEIKDYEYTIWGNGDSNVTLLDSIDSETIEQGGKVNFFSKTAGLNVLIGGVMTNSERLISYYFGLILSDRISQILTRLTLEKLKFNQSTYAYIYNVITIELDKFASNGLLDTEYVATETKLIFRDNVRYKLLENGENLIYGYSVSTLPPTQQDLQERNYTGVYILYAIANQIRTLEIQAIVLGGLQ